MHRHRKLYGNDGLFFEVFDTVEFVMQGYKLACACVACRMYFYNENVKCYMLDINENEKCLMNVFNKIQEC